MVRHTDVELVVFHFAIHVVSKLALILNDTQILRSWRYLAVTVVKSRGHENESRTDGPQLITHTDGVSLHTPSWTKT